jgi:hypothetical protein
LSNRKPQKPLKETRAAMFPKQGPAEVLVTQLPRDTPSQELLVIEGFVETLRARGRHLGRIRKLPEQAGHDIEVWEATTGSRSRSPNW